MQKKKSSKKIYLALALIVIIAVAAIGVFAFQTFSKPVTFLPGVKVNDVFTYSMKGYADLMDENASIPENFYGVNMTDYYRVTITAVAAPIVNFTTVWRFTNGTQISNVGSVNIENGDNAEFWAIYPANLTLGSPVRPSEPSGAIVNETDTKTYASGVRDRNIMSVEGEFTDLDDPTYSTMYYDSTVVYFDKTTGMLVDLTNVKIYNNPVTFTPSLFLRVVWALEDTNVWQVS
jgi:hypothetical protein